MMKPRFWHWIFLSIVIVVLLTSCIAPARSELRPITVKDVQVQIGEGSPIPVDIFVSGEWPDLCAQLAQSRFVRNGAKIELTLLATPTDPDCPEDYLGLPFRIAYPLNAVELPQGVYTVTVNGVNTLFEWTVER